MAEGFVLEVVRALGSGVPEGELVPRLARVLDEARAKWPGVTVEPERWAEHLAARLDGTRLVEALDALDGPGSYLACASLAGDTTALAHLDQELVQSATGALRRLHFDDAAIDEVLQRVRHHLLVATDGAPRLARYSGAGSLAGWLRTTAVRLASDLRRERRPEVDSEARLVELVSTGSPELAAIRSDLREHVRSAFGAALATLTDRQRALLRLSLVEELSIDRIAPLYGASRATIARWISDAKDTLAEATRRELTTRLALPAAELQSLLASVHGYVELSLSRVLAAPSSDEA